MTIEELIQLLSQSGGSGPPGGVASTTATPTTVSGAPASGGSAATTPGAPLQPSGGFPGGAGGEQALGGTLLSAGLPFAAETYGLSELPGAILEGLGLFGVGAGGIPTQAKSQGIVGALAGQGNPLDALIAKYISAGLNRGGTLSESGGSTLEGGSRRFAAMLEAITGQQAPGVTPSFPGATQFGNPSLGGAASLYRLPAGYQFANDPSKLPQIFQDIMGAIGNKAPGEGFKGGAGPQEEWQRVLRELIQQGALTKYQGPLGAVGGGGTSAGAIPNVSLPHPLAPNTAGAPAPYPV